MLRKTVLSLKSPTGAFIAPLRFANANFSEHATFGSLKENAMKTLAKRESRMTRFAYLFFTNSAWYGSSSTSASQTGVPSGV